MTERWEIDPKDPGKAHARHVWEQRLSCGDWRVRTRAEAEMTGTRDHLRMTARLTAWEGDAVVFDRKFEDLTERKFI
jgi:hypothetical protein